MFPIRTKNRKAISAVLTTIIILVASIVLGTGVVIFSTGLFQSGGSQQAVQVQNLKGWVNGTNSTGIGWGAFAVKNTGDKLVALSSITVRSAAIPFASWYVSTNQSQTNPNFQVQLISTGTSKTGYMNSNAYGANGYATSTCLANNNPSDISGVPNEITINEAGTPDTVTATFSGTMLCLTQQSGPVSLLPGNTGIVYFKYPTGLFGTTDAGVTSTVSILAGTAPVAQTIRVGNT
jgi:hypothetical protein